MSKSIQIMAIAVAFVALTLISGVVYADEKNAKPFAAIWDAISEIQLIPGPQGATGPQGADGTDGITGVYQVHESQEIKSLVGKIMIDVKATCQSGDVVLGGGVEIVDGISLFADKPFTNNGDQGWLGTFETGSVNPKVVTVDAICAKP